MVDEAERAIVPSSNGTTAQERDHVSMDHEAFKKRFCMYLERLYDVRVKSMDNFKESKGTVCFEATIKLRHGETAVYTAFVLRDGKILLLSSQEQSDRRRGAKRTEPRPCGG